MTEKHIPPTDEDLDSWWRWFGELTGPTDRFARCLITEVRHLRITQEYDRATFRGRETAIKSLRKRIEELEAKLTIQSLGAQNKDILERLS